MALKTLTPAIKATEENNVVKTPINGGSKMQNDTVIRRSKLSVLDADMK